MGFISNMKMLIGLQRAHERIHIRTGAILDRVPVQSSPYCIQELVTFPVITQQEPKHLLSSLTKDLHELNQGIGGEMIRELIRVNAPWSCNHGNDIVVLKLL